MPSLYAQNGSTVPVRYHVPSGPRQIEVSRSGVSMSLRTGRRADGLGQPDVDALPAVGLAGVHGHQILSRAERWPAPGSVRLRRTGCPAVQAHGQHAVEIDLWVFVVWMSKLGSFSGGSDSVNSRRSQICLVFQFGADVRAGRAFGAEAGRPLFPGGITNAGRDPAVALVLRGCSAI